MEKLPNEVLQMIMDNVNNTSSQDMSRLSQVSQRFRDNANLFNYRDQAIQVVSREALHEKSESLKKDDYFLENVRCLKIWGYMLEKSPEKDKESTDLPSGIDRQRQAECCSAVVWDLRTIGSEEESEYNWKPLVSLIRKCSQLTDFVWACENQLPECLFKAVTEEHANCRLHLRLFTFKSLKCGGSISEYERTLIQSRRLHSVSARPQFYSCRCEFDVLYKIIKDAPNLKHFSMMSWQDFGDEPSYAVRNQVDKCKGLGQPFKGLGEKKKSLSSLMLFFEHSHVGSRHLEEWSELVKLSTIQFLTLEPVIEIDALTYLKEVDFASLKMLDIEFKRFSGVEDENAQLLAAAERLFEKLKPLEDIHLSGLLSFSLVNTVLQVHGRTLRNISLLPEREFGPYLQVIGPELIQTIERHCPHLVHMEIRIGLETCYRNDVNLSAFCPNLENLRQIILVTEGWLTLFEIKSRRRFNERALKEEGESPSFVKHLAEKLWTVARKEKRGDRLDALHLMMKERKDSILIKSSTSEPDKFTCSKSNMEYYVSGQPNCRTYEYMFRALPERYFPY